MPGIDVNQLWTPARAVPSPQSDQKAPVTNVRGGRYGEQYVLPLIPTKHLLADEGSYFIATNPTPGTALAYNIQAAFSDTVPLFYVQNNDSKANPFGKRLYLDYIKLICTTAPASGTGARFAIKTDPAIRTISTNNTTAITPTSPNSDVATQSVCSLNVQSNATASALSASSTSARLVANASVGGIPVVGDELVLVCGPVDPGAYAGLTAAQAVCAGRKVSCLPPIILGPNSALTLYAWFPGNAATGLSYEFDVGWWERYPQQIIWDKGRTVLTRTHYWYQHEPCWYVRKKNAAWFGKAGENSTIWASASPKFIMGSSGETKYGHPTQKPIELMRRPILNHLKRSELVYDPFLGSGTTLAAAEITERVCFGMELDPKFVDVVVKRWQALTDKEATLDGDGRTFEEIAHERVPETA